MKRRSERRLTPEQARLIRAALLNHDGHTLSPEANQQEREQLTLALDVLRLELLNISEGEKL